MRKTQPAQCISGTHGASPPGEERTHPPNKVIHNVVSEHVALEMPHQSSSHLACEIGSYHGLIKHKVARGWT